MPPFNRLLSVKEGHRFRKAWEVAITLDALRTLGAVRPDASILGVGAGIEATTFILSNEVKVVHSTDLYLEAGDWAKPDFTPPQMMMGQFGQITKQSHDPQRIIVQHMDMRYLRYPDNSFDGVYSSGSIEHVGEWEDIARAASEIGRVLRPGGIAALCTEFKLSGNGDGWQGVKLFTPDLIEQHIIIPSGLSLVDEPQWGSVDVGTMATRHDLREAVRGVFPPIEGVLWFQQYDFTSVSVVLRKSL